MAIVTQKNRANGPVALIDGDGIIFRQMSGKSALDKDFYDLKESVDNKFQTILDKLNTDRYRISLTSKKSFRKDLYPEYKAKRKKVIIPYLSDMYDYVKEEWDAFVFPRFEADDCVSIDARHLRKLGIPYVVISIDGDLDQIVGRHLHPYYRPNTTQLYDISPSDAQYKFCSQMILSRSKDSLPGIKGYGPAAVAEMLTHGAKDNVKRVYDGYLKVYGEEKGKDEYKRHYTLVRLQQTPPDGYDLYQV